MSTSKLILSTLVLTLAVSPAFAKGKPASAGSGKKEEKTTAGQAKKDATHGKSGEHGKKDAEHGKAHAKSEHGRDGDPAGYDKGKKTGWGDCDAPPGQEKKAGVDCKDKDKKKSGGILGIFKRDKKAEDKAKSSAAKGKPADTGTTRQTRTTRTTATTTPTTKQTATTTTSKPVKTTTTTRTTRTSRADAPATEDKLDTAKKR